MMEKAQAEIEENIVKMQIDSQVQYSPTFSELGTWRSEIGANWKDINRYVFKILMLPLCFSKLESKFLGRIMLNQPSYPFLWRTGRLQSFLAIGWRNFT